jgi:hypothetical protein
VSRQEWIFWARRAGALMAAAALVAVIVVGVANLTGDPQGEPPVAEADAPPPPAREELPRGGRRLFPDFRVVAFYGAPQDRELGVLGAGTPRRAARRLLRQAKPYARENRPVLPAFELIATVAADAAGEDGLHRMRQTDATIRRYLRAARRAKALLVLDIQPGRAGILPEAQRLARYLREPDVGLAIDPEWHVAADEVPGDVIGSVTADEINEVSGYLAALTNRNRLPEKLLVVHQFTDDMIRDKDLVVRRPGLAVTMNVDGFGDRPNKTSKYLDFTADAPRFHDGVKLFYREDVNLMTPGAVLGLRPPPDLVVYE